MLDLKRPRVELDRQFVLIFSSVSLIFVTFFWHLTKLTPGFSALEGSAIKNSASIHSIINDPINAPHSLLLYLVHKTGLEKILYFRLVSAILAVVFLACFYKIARHWFGRMIATVATLLMAMTPSLILIGRSASADIMFLFPLAVGAAYFWYSRMDKPNWQVYLSLTAIGALSLYTPGMIWLLAASLFSIRSNIKPIIMLYSRRINAAAALVVLLILTPLIMGLTRHPDLIKDLLLLPQHLPNLDTVKNIVWSFLTLGWHSQDHSIFQIDYLPLLNAAQVVLSIFGIYALWSRARFKLIGMLVIMAIGVIGSGLTNNYSALLITLIVTCLLAAAGLRYLYIEWQGVFPRNPIPRGLAILLIALLGVASINYGLKYSLVAWPHTVSTKSVYVLK